MPVYLCQSGAGYREPWRHGIQVYAAPFPVNVSGPTSSGRDSAVLAPFGTTAPQGPQQQPSSTQAQNSTQETMEQQQGSSVMQRQATEQQINGIAIRRVRHAEIVLVDDVCIAFGRYWLRLRWPGQGKGFAGYIAMGLVTSDSNPKPKGE
jgi:hypothetical protein